MTTGKLDEENGPNISVTPKTCVALMDVVYQMKSGVLRLREV